MLVVLFGDIETVNTDASVARLINTEDAQREMSIFWDQYGLDTLVIYDLTVGVLHYLEINIKDGIPGSGDVLVDYMPPHPPSGIHEYGVYVYEQGEEFIVDSSFNYDIDRRSFDLEQFVYLHDLQEKEFAIFEVDPPEIPLTDKEVKYCHCVMDVKAKGTAYNPYAVCAKSVGTTSRRCREIE